MTTSTSKFDFLFAPVSGSALASLRILFASVMFFDVASFWMQILPGGFDLHVWAYRPEYALTAFLPGDNRPNLYVFCPLMLVSLALLLVGFWTRTAALAFTLLFAYDKVLDASRFVNHYYLIVIIGFWLTIVRSDATWSIAARRRGGAVRVPFWQQFVLALQWTIVYFYGGLAKFNADWLQAQPIQWWMSRRREMPLVGELVAHPSTSYFIAYFGLVFDLSVAFLLLWRPTRAWAMALAISFHLTNSVIFRIGPFPWLGIASLVVFLDPDTPERWVRWLRKSKDRGVDADATETEATHPTPRRRRLVLAFLFAYFLVQILVPFRHHLFRGNVEWNEVGKNFSWRMMLTTKKTFVGMRLVDRDTGVTYEVDQGGRLLDMAGGKRGQRTFLIAGGRPYLVPSRLLLPAHMEGRGVWGSPRLLGQYARFVADEARELGIRSPAVYVDAVSSMNGRPFQYLVDPDVDLASAPMPLLGTPDWVVPLVPDQPIGDYPESIDEFQHRVMEVIRRHRASKR